MLHVFTWQWGTKYNRQYAEKLFNGVSRHLSQEHQFLCINGEDYDRSLIGPGCLVRLIMFAPTWQEAYQIPAGDRIVCLDLDLIIIGNLDPLFDREEDFVILQGANAVNPCKFNGSVWMLRAGAHPEVWSDFSLEAASKVPYFAYPDDQSWMEFKMPNAAGWECGPKSGIWSFQKRGWPEGDELPSKARIVAFPGRRDPSQFTHLPWVKKHWVS